MRPTPESTSRCWESETRGVWVPRSDIKREAYGSPGRTFGADDGLVRTFKSRNGSSCKSTAPRPQCFRSSERYRWQPEAQSSMDVEHVNRDRFCDIMTRAAVRRISFVGDSMTRSMVHSLWSLLGLLNFSQFGCGNPARPECTQAVPCGPGRVVEVHQAYELNDVAQDARRIEKALLHSTLSVVNFGAHYPRMHTALASGNNSHLSHGTFINHSLALAALVGSSLSVFGTQSIVLGLCSFFE